MSELSVSSDLSLSLLSCKQMCVTLVSTRPGRVSALEDFLPLQLEHLHIAQFKGQMSFIGHVLLIQN